MEQTSFICRTKNIGKIIPAITPSLRVAKEDDALLYSHLIFQTRKCNGEKRREGIRIDVDPKPIIRSAIEIRSRARARARTSHREGAPKTRENKRRTNRWSVRWESTFSFFRHSHDSAADSKIHEWWELSLLRDAPAALRSHCGNSAHPAPRELENIQTYARGNSLDSS